MADDNQGNTAGSLGDSVHKYMQGVSEKLFNWSGADHEAAAKYAEQRADELRQLQGSPRAFKFDLDSRIKDFDDSAKYHRSKMENGDSPKSDNPFSQIKGSY